LDGNNPALQNIGRPPQDQKKKKKKKGQSGRTTQKKRRGCTSNPSPNTECGAGSKGGEEGRGKSDEEGQSVHLNKKAAPG